MRKNEELSLVSKTKKKKNSIKTIFKNIGEKALFRDN